MDHPSLAHVSAATAIQAALTAEVEAVQAVATCRQQAEQMLGEAQRRAHEITACTDAQISDLHKAYNQRIGTLEGTTTPDSAHHLPPLPDDPPAARLQTAVVRLAAWLTGEEDARRSTTTRSVTP